MFLRSLQLRRVLSFGPDAAAIEFSPLSVVVGANGSGKSNLIDVISLLQAAPHDLAAAIREGGGPGAWSWKGERKGRPDIEAVVNDEWHDLANDRLRHRLVFEEAYHRFEIFEEHIDYVARDVINVFRRTGAQQTFPELEEQSRARQLDPQRSVLAQRKDPARYPELAFLADAYANIRVYRAWTFGRQAPPRRPQPADLPGDHLLEDASNLGLVLNGFRLESAALAGVLGALGELYAGIVDFHVQVQGGMVQLFLDEGNRMLIPATRLSDGTLRWLALLAVLFDPHPPPLVCIEEPELGLHPALVPALARLLRDASRRTQLIVTTHSTALVEALAETQCVLVCVRVAGSTEICRLEGAALAAWLDTLR